MLSARMVRPTSPAAFSWDSRTVNAAAVRPLDQQQAASLMERGRELLKNGDVALAQLAFRRVAEAGS